jgi:hypothetical protein
MDAGFGQVILLYPTKMTVFIHEGLEDELVYDTLETPELVLPCVRLFRRMVALSEQYAADPQPLDRFLDLICRIPVQ